MYRCMYCIISLHVREVYICNHITFKKETKIDIASETLVGLQNFFDIFKCSYERILFFSNYFMRNTSAYIYRPMCNIFSLKEKYSTSFTNAR